MRKPLILAGALLLAHIALLAVHPSGSAQPPASEGLDVGIVFDVGGRGDKSFNDGAFLGGERAEKELGARVHFIEPVKDRTVRQGSGCWPPSTWIWSSASASSSPTT